jgi:hypothetical protein
MKDHPKWMEVRPTRTSRMPYDDIFPVDQVVDSNTADAFAEPSEPATSTRKRPFLLYVPAVLIRECKFVMTDISIVCACNFNL